MPRRRSRFINRELSWLEFNQRVLDEALDADVPLLEQLNFLSITASNLDEFFMVRVGGLEMLTDRGITKRDPCGWTPAKQLERIAVRARLMVEAQYNCYRENLEARLEEQGIRRIRAENLLPNQTTHLERYFEEEVFPVVSPMAVGRGADFPGLANLGLHVMVRLKPAKRGGKTTQRYAVIPIGANMERFVNVPSGTGFTYMTIEDVVRMFVDHLFPGEDVLEAVPFRITRNADMSAREDQAGDFLAEMENVLDQRKRGDCVRLEIKSICSKTLLSFLVRALKVKQRNVYLVPGPMDLSAFSAIAALEGFEHLRYDPWKPQPSPELDPRKSIFEELSQKDILLYHPYDSFDPVLRLVQEAAEDPDVLAVKQILYRVSRNSPVVEALRTAAERGKYVTVIVELKARFDEARNIEWARELEQAGAQVIYGVKGLKTHAKLCIVVRRETRGVVRYVHFGTGNYNERTARLYSDISYMTSDAEFGADASLFLNSVTGYSEPQALSRLVPAPMILREELLELIDSETQRRRQGQRAAIRAKMNSLVCPKIIRALYAASQAGVKIELNIRGICCLRPGVKGLSENIKVVSIVDRFLEHSRVFVFRHGGDYKMFISSADWMPRNLDRRVELMVPIVDPAARERVRTILDTHFSDTVKGRVLRSDGTYHKKRRTSRARTVRSQEALCRMAVEAGRQGKSARRQVFEPLRPPDRAGSKR